MRVSELRVGLLLYFVGTEHIHGLLLDQQGSARPFQLMRCDAASPLIDQLNRVIREPWRCTSREIASTFQRFSAQWGKALLPPAEALQHFDILVIVPHHSLHGLPFHMIRPAGTDDFLAVSHGVTYCSSGTLFTRCVDRNTARGVPLSAWQFFTDGRAPRRAPTAPRRCVSVGVDVLGDKTAQYRDVAKVFAAHFKRRESYTDRATRSMIKDPRPGRPSWEAICVVCHGHYDALVPQNSGLLLEGNIGVTSMHRMSLHRGVMYDFRDLPFHYVPMPYALTLPNQAELMTVGELQVNCRTEAQLVALLACNSGTGHVVAGDDFESPAMQWLKVGSASVLGNLWQLDLQFVSRWLPIFLRNWITRRQPKAIAWQQALKEMLDGEPGLADDLNTWGVIALMGDWL